MLLGIGVVNENYPKVEALLINALNHLNAIRKVLCRDVKDAMPLQRQSSSPACQGDRRANDRRKTMHGVRFSKSNIIQVVHGILGNLLVPVKFQGLQVAGKKTAGKDDRLDVKGEISKDAHLGCCHSISPIKVLLGCVFKDLKRNGIIKMPKIVLMMDEMKGVDNVADPANAFLGFGRNQSTRR